ncbi:unnamed protein product, partial [Mesorhabditis belari]|uniref:Ribosome production factor 2 homolog n=1 Tax=Mesorhabditis belari TaxID=2138241 RepID=A0AAF3J9K0_9BILA
MEDRALLDNMLKTKVLSELQDVGPFSSSRPDAGNILAAQQRLNIKKDLVNLRKRIEMLHAIMENEASTLTTENALLKQKTMEREGLFRTFDILDNKCKDGLMAKEGGDEEENGLMTKEDEKENVFIEEEEETTALKRTAFDHVPLACDSLDGTLFLRRAVAANSEVSLKIPMLSLDDTLPVAPKVSTANEPNDFKLPDISRSKKGNLGPLPSPPKLSRMVKRVGRIAKLKTHRGKRALDERASKVLENDKVTLFVRGGKTCNNVTDVMHDLYALKKPLARNMKRRNPFHPFEDETPFERFSTKLDASLFVFGAHSKKHPDSLTFGRLHDGQLLDMVELQVTSYTPAKDFDAQKITVGAKPCIVLEGTNWEESSMKRVGNLMVDWLSGVSPSKIRLQGLEHVISLTCVESKILLRVYRTQLKKSESNLPRVELVEMGPSVDFQVRRTKLASDQLFKQACKQPKQLQQKPRKNTSQDVFGNKLARVHIGKQDVAEIQLRKVKALKKMPEGMDSEMPEEVDEDS